MKHKVGDTVEITDCINGHQFAAGEHVKIERVSRKNEDYYASNGQQEWWITDEECKPVKPA